MAFQHCLAKLTAITVGLCMKQPTIFQNILSLFLEEEIVCCKCLFWPAFPGLPFTYRQTRHGWGKWLVLWQLFMVVEAILRLRLPWSISCLLHIIHLFCFGLYTICTVTFWFLISIFTSGKGAAPDVHATLQFCAASDKAIIP